MMVVIAVCWWTSLAITAMETFAIVMKPGSDHVVVGAYLK